MARNIVFHHILIAYVVVLLISSSNARRPRSYNVRRYGARGDGRTDATRPFETAWSLACSSRTSAVVHVPRGTYLVKNLVFEGPCKSRITFKIEGTLVAPANYWDFGSSGDWILFNKVNRVSVIGGTLYGNGVAFWSCRRKGRHCPPGARSISFNWCNNVVVSGLTSINSQMMHISVDHSNDVRLQNVKIRAPSRSPNTDGIHLQSSTGVTIFGAAILTGDDCVSIGQGSRNVWIERISCGPGHGVSIGSLGDYVDEDGVQNITVTNSVFRKTENGVRIKTWGRPSNGYARTIVFRNLVMKKVANPLIIDQNYCPDGKSKCPHQSSGVKISGVTYSNIRGTSATPVGVKLDCSSSRPCTGIRLQDIRLSYRRRPATSFCRNAHGRSFGMASPMSCLR